MCVAEYTCLLLSSKHKIMIYHMMKNIREFL